MKRARKDKPAYCFVRVGNRLLPDMDFDLGALQGIAQNEKVRVEISQWRSRPRLRAYWMMLADAVASTECAPSKEALHAILKIKCGLGEQVELPGGEVVTIPGSIALEALGEDEMVNFFRNAERWLAEHFGFVREMA